MKSVYKQGFTLIELMITALIIAILVTIAMPQYQRAVYKSRYSTVMPIAKSMADSNEMHFMAVRHYANNLADLEAAPAGMNGLSGVLENGTSLTLSNEAAHAYVLATREGVNNNYIVYQHRSPNYPDEIHCEAMDGDDRAQWLCQSLGGREIGQTITQGYTTYVLRGGGIGVAPAMLHDDDDDNGVVEDGVFTMPTCDAAIAKGYSCSVNAETRTKQVCASGDQTNQLVCRQKVYNEDGSYTSTTWRGSVYGGTPDQIYVVTYDANGNKTSLRTCSSMTEEGSCNEYSAGSSEYYTYDENGNMTSHRVCQTTAPDGSCSAYAVNVNKNQDYVWDENGNRTTLWRCRTVASDGSCSEYYEREDFTYDANGNVTRERSCNSVAADGSCNAYSSSKEYKYDANGNQIASGICGGSSMAADGSCSAYTGTSDNRTYDENGRITSLRYCKTTTSQGTCSTYNDDNAIDYLYTVDASGNEVQQMRYCSVMDANGTCSAYSNDSARDYTYDENGNKISERICLSVAANGSCSEYSNSNARDWTYTADGKQISEKNCKTVAADGHCSEYSSINPYYTFDDEGTEMYHQSCGANHITAEGECWFDRYTGYATTLPY